MPLYPKKQWIAGAVFLAACFAASFIFEKANVYYFDETKAPYIIDVRVQECLFKGLFDDQYVVDAAPAYNREKYKRSFLIIDTLFPLLYSAFFISLGYAFRRCPWHRWVMAGIILGAAFDYGENFSFLYYLYHPSAGQAVWVAFCTSIKSLLLFLNGVFGLALFVRGLLLKRVPCEKKS